MVVKLIVRPVRQNMSTGAVSSGTMGIGALEVTAVLALVLVRVTTLGLQMLLRLRRDICTVGRATAMDITILIAEDLLLPCMTKGTPSGHHLIGMRNRPIHTQLLLGLHTRNLTTPLDLQTRHTKSSSTLLAIAPIITLVIILASTAALTIVKWMLLMDVDTLFRVAHSRGQG